MDKWADYLISAVCYNDEETRIEKVRSHEDLGDKVGSSEEISRSAVIYRMENGKTYATIVKRDGKWHKGEDIHIIEVEGQKFIRTDRNRKKADNLGELPRS